MARKFYKTVITTVILSEYPVDPLSTLELLMGGQNGDFSVRSDRTKSSEEVDGATMANLLIEQESEPEFFDLDEKGNDA